VAKRGLSAGLLVSLQFLSGCTGAEKERADAIAEVEKHCSLSSGSLAQIYVYGPNNRPKSHSPDVWGDRLIRLGPLINSDLLQRQKCVNSFKSSKGFRFELRQVSPYVIPGS
jgi:hypothetical protein